MKQPLGHLVLLLLLSLLAVVSCTNPEPTSWTPSGSPSRVKVEFIVTPSIFTAEGGVGNVRGLLKEFTSHGEQLKEVPLDNSGFTLSLRSGDPALITIDDVGKQFTVSGGVEEMTFVLLAKVKGNDKLMQEISIKREAKKEPTPVVIHPLEYVAEYNVAPAGDRFVTTHDTGVSGFYTVEDAVARFAAITISGSPYHLPSIDEWRAIIPALPSNTNFCLKFDKSDKLFTDVEESVALRGETIISRNDYRMGLNEVSYGVRFKDTPLASAWRYEYANQGDQQILKVTSRLLAKDENVSIEMVADPAFWQEHNGKDIVRYFPASGYKMDVDGDTLYGGSDGSFWSATAKSDKNAWGMYFYYEEAHLYDLSPRSFLRSVRLFLGK